MRARFTQRGISRRDFLKAAGAAGAGLSLAKYLPVFAQDNPSGAITYWHHFTSESEFNGMERVIALFQEKFPEITLTQENIPNPEFMAKFTAAVVADTRPDTTMIAAERLQDMVAMDGVLDLTDRVENWALKEFFPDNRWTGITLDGKIYGVPAFTFIDWMYYRKDWFEEAGIDGPPTTLEEFQDAAIRLTDPSQGRYGFGLRAGAGGQGMIVDMITAFGSSIVVDGQAAMDRDKAIEALTFYSELFTRHHVVPPSAPDDGYRQIMEAFETGQTAMVWHHTGSLVEVGGLLTTDQFGTAVKPTGPVNNLTGVSYLYNGLMKDDNADAAWAWVSFWGENDPAIAFLEETGYFPVSTAVTDDERISGNPLYQAAIDSLAIGHDPVSFVGSSGWQSDVVLPAFQKILLGEYTVEEAVDEMMQGLEDALA
jgi:multiple sugar transport system substrate-binding protein